MIEDPRRPASQYPSNEIRLTDPTTGAQKGQKPQRFALLPWVSIAAIAEVYHYGTRKYAEHNWRGGYPWSWSYDALQRHLSAWWEGEDTDPESGLSHLAHAGFHVLSLLYYKIRGKGTDDRFKEVKKEHASLIPEWAKKAKEADIHRWADARVPQVQLRGLLRRGAEPKPLGLGVPEPGAYGHGAASAGYGPGQVAIGADVDVREEGYGRTSVPGPDGF